MFCLDSTAVMDRSNLLIDFNSPAHKKDLALPLIPVPPQTSLAPNELDEPLADPFDVQEVGAPDPFECVLQLAANNSNSEQTAAEDVVVSLGNESEQIQIFVSCEDKTDVKISSSEQIETHGESVGLCSENVLDKSIEKNYEVTSGNEIPNDGKCHFEKSPHVETIIHDNTHDSLKNTSKSSVTTGNHSKSQISADFSTEESLKAVIARRVNKCIQDTLNGSVKIGQITGSEKLKMPQNKRSLSFVGLPSTANKECDRLNKSCTDVIDNPNLENQNFEASSDNSGFGLLSPNSSDMSTEMKAEEQVFKEAHRLSRTFSKLAKSFRREQESDSDSEDLISCKPRWYSDSSEDEEVKLQKDPALNFRRRSDGITCSSPAPAFLGSSKVPDSPALLAYKSRRSLTQVQSGHNNTQEEFTMKRSISMGSQFREVSAVPPLASAGPFNFMKTEVQPIKLRKNFGGENKKGPLRAVVPIQCMTKEPLAMIGKLAPKQESSPESRLQRPAQTLLTPIKGQDGSQMNIVPVASSTPNKGECHTDSRVSDSLLVTSTTATNKRHSLEGSFGNHKSRGVMSDFGARPRSNSASSSIPRVMVRPSLKGLPVAPKSTSNLVRPTNNQMNVKKVSEKKKTPQIKSSVNARVLADVKTKSPRQSKIKSAVNTISNLVKSKKTARDKENRLPA